MCCPVKNFRIILVYHYITFAVINTSAYILRSTFEKIKSSQSYSRSNHLKKMDNSPCQCKNEHLRNHQSEGRVANTVQLQEDQFRTLNDEIASSTKASDSTGIPGPSSAGPKGQISSKVVNVTQNGFMKSSKYSEMECQDSSENRSHSDHPTSPSFWERTLPRNSSYWPKLKLFVLIILGCIPWLFILVYVVIYYI